MKTTETKRRGRPLMRADEKKKSTSFYLSDETREDLRALAADTRLSQASVVETLVRDAARKMKAASTRAA
jgi:predicted DNA-binding protein